MTTAEISAAFPFESRYVDVLGSKMHYVARHTICSQRTCHIA